MFTVFRCNQFAVEWFIDHFIAILRIGINGIESMDYSQIQAAMQLEQVEKPAALFKQLRCIERGYMEGVREAQRKSK